MIRLTLRIITVLSLLVFMGCAWLWVRSYSVSDFCKHEVVRRSGATVHRQTLNIVCGRGGVCFNRVNEMQSGPITPPAPKTQPAPTTQPTTQPAPTIQTADEHVKQLANDGWDHDKLTQVGYAGNYIQLANQPTRFGYAKATVNSAKDGKTTTSTFIVFPIALPALAFALLPFIGTMRLVIAFRRHRRLKKLNYHEVHTKSVV
jgi:hypothetical protein